MKNFRENLMHAVFFVCALTSIAAVVLICVFLFANGVPAMHEIGLLDFLTGAKWKPGNDIYGILPMILGSIYIFRTCTKNRYTHLHKCFRKLDSCLSTKLYYCSVRFFKINYILYIFRCQWLKIKLVGNIKVS